MGSTDRPPLHHHKSPPHVLLLPYPTQGHINPLLQFGKRLASVYGLRVSFALPRSSLASTNAALPSLSPITLVPISDGNDDGQFPKGKSIASYLADFKVAGSATLGEAMDRMATEGNPVDCVVYDSFLQWAVDVARQRGVAVATFFTQSCTVGAVYNGAYRGTVPLSLPLDGPAVEVEGLPVAIGVEDAPSFLAGPTTGLYAAYKEMLLNQFSNLAEVDVVLFNTFYELEAEVMDFLSKTWPTKAIGPTIPSIYTDNRVEGDSHYGFDLYTRLDCPCTEWLSTKPPRSVVYVSFGSLASLDREQMEEVAHGLRGSKKSFLWVVRASETASLPDKFRDLASPEELVVPWSPQLEVLAHPSLGCFVTHCGWNSTLEALTLGVPMVGIPQWTDQPTNAKLVEGLWRVGVRARADEKGVVRRGEVEACVRMVMEGEKGEAMRRNALKWKELAAGSVMEGGSSDKSIREFIAVISKN